MSSYLPLFIGWRYLFSKRRDGFVSFVSFLSCAAMALGVTALITVLSVMNGFDYELKTRILQIAPHATVSLPEGIERWQSLETTVARWDNVAGAEPYISGQAMLSRGERLQAVLMEGIAPDRVTARGLSSQLVEGKWLAPAQGTYGLVIGQLLADALNATTGDEVLVTLPELTMTPLGAFPRVKRMTIVGVFRVGAPVDAGLAFLHIDDADKLFRTTGSVTGLRLFLHDPFDLEDLFTNAENTAAEYRLTTWQQSMSELFSAIKMEKTVVSLLLSLIIAIAAFNIVASLVLMVNEKRTDIAVLRTLGTLPSDVARIFQIQGGCSGLIGVIIGVLAGCTLSLYIGDLLAFFERVFGFALFDPGLYFITRLPSQLQLADVATVAALAMFLSVLASWYPASRASRIPPADALRYR